MLLSAEFLLAQGKLDEFRDTVRTEKEDNSRYQGFNDDDDEDNDVEHRGFYQSILDMIDFTRFISAVISSPFAIPHSIWDEKGYAQFCEYPYQNDYPGFMRKITNSESPSDFNFRIQFETGYDFEGVASFSGNFLLDTESRLSFELGASYMREWIEESVYDTLNTGEFNILWRFVQSPNLQMRAGLGIRYMNDYIGTERGFNFTYGLDLYPVKPWIVSASVDFGSLGEANVSSARFTVGAAVKRFELYAGYNSLRVDTVEIHGPVAGIRYWI
jgi:hypothetical protein